jgi:hypothetical protein
MEEQEKASDLYDLLLEFCRENNQGGVCSFQCYLFKRIIPSSKILKWYMNREIVNLEEHCRAKISVTHYVVKIGEKIFDPSGDFEEERFKWAEEKGKIKIINLCLTSHPIYRFKESPAEEDMNKRFKELKNNDFSGSELYWTTDVPESLIKLHNSLKDCFVKCS